MGCDGAPAMAPLGSFDMVGAGHRSHPICLVDLKGGVDTCGPNRCTWHAPETRG